MFAGFFRGAASRRGIKTFGWRFPPIRRFSVCDFIQARNPDWVRKPFFAEFDDTAVWFDDRRARSNPPA